MGPPHSVWVSPSMCACWCILHNNVGPCADPRCRDIYRPTHLNICRQLTCDPKTAPSALTRDNLPHLIGTCVLPIAWFQCVELCRSQVFVHSSFAVRIWRVGSFVRFSRHEFRTVNCTWYLHWQFPSRWFASIFQRVRYVYALGPNRNVLLVHHKFVDQDA